jgi:hypothetical protein
MLERNFRQQSYVADKYLKVTAAAALTVRDQVVRVTAGAGNFAVTLPNVSEAAGLIFSLYLVATGGGQVTVQDNDESEGWADMVMTAANDMVLLYSDGITWFKIVDITT